ncbi:MFS transporter [Desulfosporosinus sp. PR]|uniref:MFS transporter n=1 Tax=Candidatus Desulfosporosinus nitrosoreducens TaxID=3401928 RepID=UPI0027EFBA05|nr:MFS transporter [Desulfosporosinus sp. PR]MDQ7095144.1 MFS transporter [Desulfosporosinus sp. PR]
MASLGEKSLKKWVRLAILCIGAGMIYQLPLLQMTYYKPLQAALKLTNEQLGFLTSTYGLVAMFCYFPGGWLADHVSSRKLLAISYVATGLGGFYLATYPSYQLTILLYGYWGVTAILTYWPALIKATRDLGDSSEQGRLFGFLEGGRGLASTFVGMAILFVFAKLGEGVLGLSWVINLYALMCVAAGILTWLLFEDLRLSETSESLWAGVIRAIKMPVVWIIGVIIFCTYTMFAGQSYLTPYVTDIFGASVSLAALLGLVRTYALQTLGAPVGGIIVDKVGSATKIIVCGFIVMLISLGLFLLIPGKPNLLVLVIINMIVLGLIVYVMRGIYYATVDEVKIPSSFTGAAVGLASLIGFLPDAFIYPLFGRWMDSHAGIAGYKIIFTYLTVIGAIGLVFAVILLGMIKSKNVAKNDPLRAVAK